MDEQFHGGFGDVFLSDDRTTITKNYLKFHRYKKNEKHPKTEKERKKLDKQAEERNRIFYSREVAVLSYLSSLETKITAEFYSAKEKRNDFRIKMEFLDGIEPVKYFSKNFGKDRYQMLLEIAKTINILHNREIVHLDIKNKNIVVVDSKPYLIDFGLSRFVFDVDSEINSGTRGYKAPELYVEIEKRNIQNPKALDVFSFGVLCYLCVMGKGTALEVPWRETGIIKPKILEKMGKYPCEKELGKFLKEVLNQDPEKRPTIRKILLWFKQFLKIEEPNFWGPEKPILQESSEEIFEEN